VLRVAGDDDGQRADTGTRARTPGKAEALVSRSAAPPTVASAAQERSQPPWPPNLLRKSELSGTRARKPPAPNSQIRVGVTK
jgi:hypothetical protein